MVRRGGRHQTCSTGSRRATGGLRICPLKCSWVWRWRPVLGSGFMRLFFVEDTVRSGDGARAGGGRARNDSGASAILAEVGGRKKASLRGRE